MKFTAKSKRNLALLTLLCVCYQVVAHDAWVAPGKGPVFHILYGHKIAEKYVPTKVTALHVLDSDQRELPFQRKNDSNGVSIRLTKGTPAVFVLDYDNGYWVKLNGKSINVRHSLQPEGTDAVHPLKYSKTVMSWLPWLAKPLGQRIEFVPVSVKKSPRAGSQITLRLLLDGKPLSGQMVENNSDERGPSTDANGEVTVTVLQGINRFATDYDIHQKDPDASRLSLTAAFVFIAK